MNTQLSMAEQVELFTRRLTELQIYDDAFEICVLKRGVTFEEILSNECKSHQRAARIEFAFFLARRFGWGTSAIARFLRREETTVKNWFRREKRLRKEVPVPRESGKELKADTGE
jgi:hypothetical protein